MAIVDYSKNPFETLTDEEEKLEKDQIGEIAKITVELLKKRYPNPMQILRGVHPKSHGCVHAKFEVLAKIDSSLKVGLFARPSTYKADIRYSNASTSITHDLSDGKNASRGMAIKVRDVEGDVLLEDTSGEASQDFLMINTASFAFVDTAQYLKLNEVLLKDDDASTNFFKPFFVAKAKPPTDPAEIAEISRIGQSLAAVGRIQGEAVSNPLEVAYFSGAPYLFGKDRCMHFSVVPQGPKKPQAQPTNAGFDYLREALEATMAGDEDVVYDFRVQVRNKGEKDLFIEDATRSWDEKKYPPQTVARITIPAPQMGLSTREHLDECEQLVYTPWHALADHRPLGSINRLRYEIYKASANFRQGK